MKKIIILVLGIILVIGSGFFWFQSHAVMTDNNQNKESAKNNLSSLTNLFTIMVQDENNEYNKVDAFPSRGYVYNSPKSGCYNHKKEYITSALTYNKEDNIALVNSDDVVDCYLYFDKEQED